jgi:hypothetical protein
LVFSSFHSQLTICAHLRCPESLVIAIIFHQLFEGLSLGIRIASLPPPRDGNIATSEHDTCTDFEPRRRPRGRLLEQVLALLFAITTPAGIGIGLRIFTSGSGNGGKDLAVFPLNHMADLPLSSPNETRSGSHVCYISRNADLRVVCGDVSR